MVNNGGVKFIIPILLVALIYFKMIENSLESRFYTLLNENRRSMSFEKEKLNKSQISNDTIYENGIAHLEINDLNPKLKEIKIFEAAFKNIVAMNGVKYIYKRNFYWRTWREVKDAKGNTSVICYRCQNIMNITCSSCNCGYWEMEENPPCPYEIFSVINKTNVCVAYYNQLKNLNDNCPSIVSFRDLGRCDNPIEARWRVNRQHGARNVSERYVDVICEERENCAFSTIYAIFPDRVIFRIINSSDYIVYSRIMKNYNRNYVCLKNCGMFKSISHVQAKLRDRKTLTPPEFKNNTENYLNDNYSKKDTLLLSKTKWNSSIIKLNSIKIPRNIHHSKDGMKASTLRCKHLRTARSEEEDEESEYNDY